MVVNKKIFPLSNVKKNWQMPFRTNVVQKKKKPDKKGKYSKTPVDIT